MEPTYRERIGARLPAAYMIARQRPIQLNLLS